MKILVELNIPIGKTCKSCKFIFDNTLDMRLECSLFGNTVLKYCPDLMKCKKCLNAIKKHESHSYNKLREIFSDDFRSLT